MMIALCALAVPAFAQEEREVSSDLADDEAAQIAVLQSDAGWLEKQAACRALRQIGTANAVPALAALLDDEHLAHLARFALEPMPAPEAAKALRDALGTTEGLYKEGVIISIGARGDAEAVPLLTPLLKDENAQIAGAAAGALGRIGTVNAAQALLDYAPQAPEATRVAVAEGLLAAGPGLVQAKEKKLAAAAYEEMLKESWPMHIRTGAFRGLVEAQKQKANERLLSALGGEDPVFRGFAAQLVAEGKGPQKTKQLADALAGLPAAGQAALLRGLANRGDANAHDAVVKAVENADAQVKTAAVAALEELGTAGDVEMLVGFLQSGDKDAATAAATSIRGMLAEGVDEALVKALDAQPEARPQVLALLSERGDADAIPMALAHLNDDHVEVRVAALNTLYQLGETAHIEQVIEVVRTAEDNAVRNAAAKALNALAARGGGDALSYIIAAMDGANVDAKGIMLRSLDRIGTDKALERVVAAMDDPEQAISDEAVSVLGGWPTQEAAPFLLTLAQGDNASRRDIALRGYVRLARDEQQPSKKQEMLDTAMGLAKEPQDKWIVLSAWGTYIHPAALDALKPHLDDPAVRNEAATAIISVAGELGKQGDNPKQASKDALTLVQQKVEDEAIKQRAQQVMDSLG
ncbi:MAG: HEAT repeat domain-containing protein [Candidatus Hydrogenedentes bacterium]|nr:HEAT repeat domain-containing protein [Candidatus Hydrogenedentota bacterium]